MKKIPKKYHIQNIIARLQDFWSKQGCAVLQPYDMPVGAGTFHPATTLRAIDTDEWNAVYVQPSRRPTDGRYGLHPNRLQRYYQLQVVMKPSPDNFQQLYLDSIRHLGIDAKEHDIRFIEDDWKSPTLGAWGLGWEVWCDGMEVSQFTYFQEVGGIKCFPVMGEITYGIERLAMYLQGVDDVYDLRWNKERTYRDLYKQNEEQQSQYNFVFKKNTDYLLEQFEKEVRHIKELLVPSEFDRYDSLFLPAYEAVLTCSHLFNVLDARRFFSIEKRDDTIRRIRNLSCMVAKIASDKFKANRAKQELEPTEKAISKTITENKIEEETDNATISEVTKPSSLLVEINCEELPPDLLYQIAIDLGLSLKNNLAKANLLEKNKQLDNDEFLNDFAVQFEQPDYDQTMLQKYGLIIYPTPRRIGALIKDVKGISDEKSTELRGPAKDAPKQAIEGFLQKHQKKYEDLITVEYKEKQYFAIKNIQPAQSLSSVLGNTLEQIINSMQIPRKMQWGDNTHQFARPISHWCIVHGNDELNVIVFKQKSTNKSRKRVNGELQDIEITEADDYKKIMEDSAVYVLPWQRKQRINSQLKQISDDIENVCIKDDELVSQIVKITENPNAYTAKFDNDLLEELPEEIVQACLQKHTKCIAIKDNNNKLKSEAVFVADSYFSDSSKHKQGVSRVLNARLRDDALIHEQDNKLGVSEVSGRLSDMRYFDVSMSTRLRNLEQIIVDLKNDKKLVELFSISQDELGNTTEILQTAIKAYFYGFALDLSYEYPKFESILATKFFNLKQSYIYQHTSLKREEDIKIISELVYGLQQEVNVEKTLTDVLILVLELERIANFALKQNLPSASKDPHGLKASALRVIEVLAKYPTIETNELLHHFSNSIVDSFTGIDAKGLKSNIFLNVKDFIIDRLIAYLSYKYDSRICDACISRVRQQSIKLNSLFVTNVVNVVIGLAELKEVPQRDVFDKLLALDKRLKKIVSSKSHDNLDKKIAELLIWNKTRLGEIPNYTKEVIQKVQTDFGEKEVGKLGKKLQEITNEYLVKLLSKDDISHSSTEVNKHYKELVDVMYIPINRYFDETLINDPDDDIREKRLELVVNTNFVLNKFVNLPSLYS